LITVKDLSQTTRKGIKMMLADVPDNTRIRFGDIELDFKHLDGTYSLCYNGDEVVRLPRWTEVEIVSAEE